MDEQLCPIAHHAKLHPDMPSLIASDKRWTYRQCDRVIQGLSLYLHMQGIASQSRIAFIARPTPPVIFLFFALFRLKAIACPLSFREPIEKIPLFIEALDASHYLEPDKLPLDPSSSRIFSTLNKNALATFLFTSGSSGNPKIACHTLNHYFYNALGAASFLSLNSSSRWLLSLPLFHVGGLSILFRIFLTGGTIVLSDLPLIHAVKNNAITHLSLVPTQLMRLLREEKVKEAAKELCCLLIGGAPLSASLFKEAAENELPIITTYGMTEMSSMITAAQKPKAVHVGTALPYRAVSLSPEKEILVRGNTFFSGYWEKKTHEISFPQVDGWFPTQDLGEYTKEGNLCILGRKDRLFISGGENIHPEEIECALCCIPGISSATVLPVSDPEFGQRPVAFIQDDTSQLSSEGIREALRSLLPSFKHPIRFFSYPQSNDFKINYSYLKKHLLKRL